MSFKTGDKVFIPMWNMKATVVEWSMADTVQNERVAIRVDDISDEFYSGSFRHNWCNPSELVLITKLFKVLE